jgi:hypothetical protein
MSFLRHREIYPSDGGKTLTGRAPTHRLDEFPTGYSLASCSPAEPASASPVNLILLRLHSFVYEVSANGNLSLIFVSHRRGAAHYETPVFGGPPISEFRTVPVSMKAERAAYRKLLLDCRDLLAALPNPLGMDVELA